MMSTLYIDHKEARLRSEGGALVVYRGDTRDRCIPARMLEHVIIVQRAQLDTTVLGLLMENGVQVSFCQARDPARWGSVAGPCANNIFLRSRQHMVWQQKTTRLRIARFVIGGKLRRYTRLFERLLAARPGKRYAITRALRVLQGARTRLPDVCNLPALRGLEGSAARAVFSAYIDIVPSRYGFQGRNRRPPADPVNALLSLTYTLLNSRLNAVLHGLGFDTGLGFLHENVQGRPGLVLDMLEMYRACADEQVLNWITGNTLRMEHFSQEKTACLLNKPGRRKFYEQFETWVPPIQEAMRREMYRLYQLLKKVDVQV